MTVEADTPDWTPIRLETLAAAVEHLLPMAEAHSKPTLSPAERCQTAEAVARFVTEALSSPRWEAQQPFVLAALDELHDLASNPDSEGLTDGRRRSLAETTPAERERLLRHLEVDSNPYLPHAVGLLLQLGLEGFLGDPRHGGNPDGLGWTSLGLTPLGPRRRLSTGERQDP